MYSTFDGAKTSAKTLKRLFDDSGIIFPLQKCQLAVAKGGGFQHWHDLQQNLARRERAVDPDQYRRRLLASLPEPCRNPVRAWLDREPAPDSSVEGYPVRWYRDVYPYLSAVTKLHRRTPLLRPGSGRGQQMRELLVYELLLNLKGGHRDAPQLDPEDLALCFRGSLAELYPAQIGHPDFERELARLLEARILEWRHGVMRVRAPDVDVEAEVRETKAEMAQHWSERDDGEADSHERLMALREALASVGVSNALRIAEAISEQGSQAYITPSGAMLDLLSTLAAEGDLETFARAVDLAATIHSDNAPFVRDLVPAKIASNYFGARLRLPTQAFITWTTANPEWTDRLTEALRDPDAFRAAAEAIADEVRALPSAA